MVLYGSNGGEKWKQRRHMWPTVTVIPPAAATGTASPPSDSPPSSQLHFFSKDGRKIRVGDCALFKPPQDSPPFIGIIRKLTLGIEDSPSLGVNWLYRPSDVKLAKGASLEAAPNEIFYSFHKDEIPAASLLHPCKVAFLRKGVELPSGICSFVCRRVYDIENKCLWWLTDKDYINERQEEVDQLLDKTRLEMNGVVQSGGRSPKPLNGPTSTPPLKSGPDSVQNSTSFSSQVKGKKRERGDHSSDPSKRERLVKSDDGESGHCSTESMLKSEIAKITEKGGLIDFEGVERLVQLMQPSSADRKIDLAGRIMLVDVIAATDRFDCLGRFVQLKGLPVLDEWLQEVHKGKIGDVSNPREGDKSVEEFLFALLRALDKLPVNLHALQTCNVGKSVNHLRSHKNSEIQKKARSLVDTWKKRVEAEMNMNDAKSGSSRVPWTTKPAPSEVSHVGNRKSGGSAEVKCSVGQPSSSKNSQSKLGAGDALAKSSVSPGSMKSLTTAGSNSKDSNIRTSVTGGTSDLALTPIKEERSSSSSQSQSNSQCCSSDHAKTVGSSCREDARSSTAGSVSVSKMSTGGSRHRKSSNSLHGSVGSGVQKEVGSGKISSSNRNSTSEKASPSLISHEKSPDTPVADHGNNHRLIVRLPNTSRSPSRGAGGGSFEDPSVTCSRASPSADKQDNLDRKVKSKGDSLQATIMSNKNSDVCHGKDEFPVSEQGIVSAAGDDRGRADEAGEKFLEGSKASGSTSGLLPRSGKSYEASLSSINALIESCVKISETNASALPGDDVGMNLLASVAAGEIPKSENVSPSGSPQGDSLALEEFCSGNDEKLGHTVEEVSQGHCQHKIGSDGGSSAKQDMLLDSLQVKNESICPSIPTSTNVPLDSRVTSAGCDEIGVEGQASVNASSTPLQGVGDGPHFKPEVKPYETTQDASAGVCSSNAKKENETECAKKFDEHRKPGIQRGRGSCITDSKSTGKISIDEEKKVERADEITTSSTVSVVTEAAGLSEKVENRCSSSRTGGDNHISVNRVSSTGVLTEEKQSICAEINPESREAKSDDAVLHSETGSVICKECDAVKAGDKTSRLTVETERQTMEPGPSDLDENTECYEGELGNDLSGRCSGASALPVDSATGSVQENEQHEKSSRCKLDVEDERKEERHASGSGTSGSAAGSGMALKVDFDLNEGFTGDDTSHGEPVKPVISGTSSAVHLSCPMPFSIPSLPGSFPTSITVAAAAKGPFVPPENLMRSKLEPGWKGSAATSAFRPAEPRKNVEVPVSTTDVPAADKASGRQGRAPLDFDLNVPDERVLEDVGSHSSSQATCPGSGPGDRGTGGLDLDLNRVDDSPDVGPLSVSSSSKFEIPPGPNRPTLSGGLSNGGGNASRGFDLNNGPGLDELNTETAPHGQPVKNSVPFPAPTPGVRTNSVEFGNFSSWFPPGGSYSGITIPPILLSRGEKSLVDAAAESQRILAPSAGSASFGPEIFRGPVLSSSPAVTFSPAPFQYQGFPFETSFPLSSNSFSGSSTAYMESSSGAALCFPTIPPQLVGPAVVSSPFPRPYVVSLPSGTGAVSTENRNWGSQGLDLNAGPSSTDTERRDERLPAALRHMSVPSSQALAEEQLKMYQVAGGMFKRKEPDGGWDGAGRFSYKHSWQ